MTNQELRRRAVFLAVAFIICLAADGVSAQDTTTQIAIQYKTVYPGKFTDVSVLLKNPDVEIAGAEFLITLWNIELADFHTDSIKVDTITIPVDTCTWEPPPEHPDECYVDSLVDVPVRYCYIDTVGSLISDFEVVQCHGDTGDTSSPECKWAEVLVLAQLVGDSIYIDRSGSWGLLFRFGVDVLCLPDSATDRTEYFLLNPNVSSRLSDRQGNTVPFKYNQFQSGELLIWWSVPGDANGDSLVSAGDVVYLLSYLYRHGPPPCVPEAGDANADCFVNAGDIVYLLTYLYRNGPPPQRGCWYGGKED